MALNTTESLLALYTAYFNRAADADGFNYWLGNLNNGWNINMVAQSFSEQNEFTNTYSGLSEIQIVQKVYNNVLNRDGESAGVEYWTKELTSGKISVNNLIQAVVSAATETDSFGNPVNSTDSSVVTNKNLVSQYYVENNINLTTISLADISSDTSSVSIAQQNANQYITEDSLNGLYTGSYSGSYSGYLAFNIINDAVSGYWYNPSFDEVGAVTGTLSGNTITASDGYNTFIATESNSNFNGSWEGEGSGNWNAQEITTVGISAENYIMNLYYN